MRKNLGLLTLGVFLTIAAIWGGAMILGLIPISHAVSLILISTGIWTIAVAGIKAKRPEEKGGAFGNFSWGMLFIVIGGSWYLSSTGMPIELTVVFVLLLLGTLAIYASLKSR